MKFLDLVESYGPSGSDDNGPELMEKWLSELTLDDVIEYACIAHNKGLTLDEIFKI